jgi:hypothetical protein
MVTKTAAKTGEELVIHDIKQERLTAYIVGTSPLICNRMARKAWFELLAPRTKTAADRAATMKHDPVREFRDSPYRLKPDDAPTLIAVPPTAFKKAMGTAALDMPGTKKAQIGRLVSVNWELMPIWGVPRLFMAVTRSADINKTPDIRTRAILPEWACELQVWFQRPILREQSVANLLAAAGRLSGIGDWRQEKGSGSFGSFRICAPDDKQYVRILATGGRLAQMEALENPVPYDDEAAEMLAWFEGEVVNRGFQAVSQTTARKGSKGNGVAVDAQQGV